MLAFTTLYCGWLRCNSCCNRLTQPDARGMPYAADRLSPNTSMVCCCALLTPDSRQHAHNKIDLKKVENFMASILRAMNLGKQVESGGQPLVILHEVSFPSSPATALRFWVRPVPVSPLCWDC